MIRGPDIRSYVTVCFEIEPCVQDKQHSKHASFLVIIMPIANSVDSTMDILSRRILPDLRNAIGLFVNRRVVKWLERSPCSR